MPFRLGAGLGCLIYLSGFLNIVNREGKSTLWLCTQHCNRHFHICSLSYAFCPLVLKHPGSWTLSPDCFGSHQDSSLLSYCVIVVRMLNFSEPQISSKKKKKKDNPLRQIGE